MNLFKALSYKEWIKTRKVIGVLFTATIAVLAYSFIEVTHSIRLDEAVNEWYAFLFMDKSLPLITMILPLISGLALALVQFVPEMVNKRLKLTLHLPADETSIISSMLMYGYLVLVLMFALTIIVYVCGMSFIFPYEATYMMIARLTPSFVSGLAVYGFTAWVCFEPQWKQRVLNLLIAVGLISVLFVSQQSGVYLHFGLGLIVIFIASFAFPFFSVLRFNMVFSN